MVIGSLERRGDEVQSRGVLEDDHPVLLPVLPDQLPAKVVEVGQDLPQGNGRLLLG